MANMRAVSSAQHAFFATKGNNSGYGLLVDLMNENLLDRSFASDPKGGYDFNFTPLEKSDGNINSFVISAIPAVSSGTGRNGNRRFGSSPNGVMYADDDRDTLGTHYTELNQLATAMSNPSARDNAADDKKRHSNAAEFCYEPARHPPNTAYRCPLCLAIT